MSQPFVRKFRRRIASLASGVLVLLALLPSAQSSVQGPRNTRTERLRLHTIKQIRSLESSEISSGADADVRGTVTYYDAVGPNLFVQDRTGGIWVDLRDTEAAPPHVGEVLDLRAVIRSGFSPYLAQPRWKVVASRSFPVAVRITYEQAVTGTFDGEWVEMEGVVRSFIQQAEGDVLVIDVATPTGSFKVRVPNYQLPFPRQLVDAKVKFRGVCGATFNRHKQLVAIHLFTPTFADMDIVNAGSEEPFAVLATPIDQILQFSANVHDLHRIKVVGTVTAQFPGQGLFLMDASGGLYAETSDGPQFTAGDEIEVIGFPAQGKYTPILKSANIHSLNKHKAIAPAKVDGTAALHGQYDAQLITISAVLESRIHPGDRTLRLESDDHVPFEARFIAPVNERLPVIGSRVSLTGVCSIKTDENGEPAAFELVLRDPGDVVLLSSPPWLNSRRAVSIFFTTALVILAALAWIYVLRRRVKQQTELIKVRLEKEASLQEQYQRIFERNLAGLYICSLDGNLLHCNDTCARILGYANRGELLQDREQAAVIARQFHRVLIEESDGSTQSIVNRELHFRRKDDSWGWALTNISVIPNNGSPGLIEGVLIDITNRKESESQLRLHTAILQTVANAICITDRSGNIIWVNAAFSQLTGYEADEVVGRNPRLLGSGRQDSDFYGSMWKTISSGLTWHGEITNRKKTGEIYEEEMTITPVLDDSRQIQYFVAIKQDITGRKALEDQLRQAQKMEAVGRLAGGMAHDFNNVLMVISSYAELLELSTSSEEKKGKYIGQIRDACKRAAALIEQLLAFSRKQVQQKKVLSLNKVILDSEKMLSTLVGEDIRIELKLSDRILPVTADPAQVVQILMNLTANARDAMPEGGTLLVSTRSEDLSEYSCSKRPGLKPGVHTLLVVSDTGAGFDDQTKARIFEPFFTTKALGKGTGLGLATVYGIVKQSDGYIDVHSVPKVGTTFTIYFRGEHSQPEQDDDRPKLQVHQGSEKILLVEDESSLRQALAERLRRSGYIVLEAATGQDAIELARDNPSIDLLISDIVLPDIRGPQVYEQIRASIGEKRTIFMSGHVDPSLIRRHMMQSKSTLLRKPFAFSTLLESIRNTSATTQ